MGEARRLRQLEDENPRLKHIVAEPVLDLQAWKGVRAKKFSRPQPAGRQWAFSKMTSCVWLVNISSSSNFATNFDLIQASMTTPNELSGT